MTLMNLLRLLVPRLDVDRATDVVMTEYRRRREHVARERERVDSETFEHLDRTQEIVARIESRRLPPTNGAPRVAH